MFSRSQRFYDAIYSSKDYAGEAEKLDRLICERVPDAQTLLDVACGTGKHVELLRERYRVEAVELDPEMAAIARRRLPGVPVHERDMLDFELGRTFDAVTCLFSSIAYVLTPEALNRAVANMARHVSRPGVLIVEPFFTPSTFQSGRAWAKFVDEPDLKVARFDIPRVDGRVAVLEFHYLVATPAGIEHFTEVHRLALFEHEEYLHALASAGLHAEHDREGLMGRGLYLGMPA